jgi:rhamnogalacturonyl hydrolase YesR
MTSSLRRSFTLASFFVFLLSLSGFAETWKFGLTSNDQPIEAIVVAGPSASAPTVLLIGGLQGKDATVEIVAGEAAAFEALPAARRPFRLIAVPLANPEARPLQFPPTGVAYKENAESHVLWRWIGIQAPDLVIVAGETDAGLTEALSQNAVAFVGRIPAQRQAPRRGMLAATSGQIPASEARREIERRRSRSPRALAEELSKVYGQDFSQPTYILAMAVIGQLQLGATDMVTRILEPYLSGKQNSFAKPSQTSLASHMLFFEYAKRTRDERATKLVVNAANSGFTEAGELREFMPLHGGWSDSVFMDIPILAKAGALTGEKKYFDMAARHLRFMHKIVFRPDGLYRHQASSDAAWGRGNGFPALGLALTLADFPKDHPEYAFLLQSFQQHMKALSQYQDENGMWREVIDAPGAYPEYSGTAMIATAMLRGVRSGWLDSKTYQPLIDRAWLSIVTRTASDGRVFDVAESTGTRGLTHRDYLRRGAILDRDPRAGAFALIFAADLAGL